MPSSLVALSIVPVEENEMILSDKKRDARRRLFFYDNRFNNTLIPFFTSYFGNIPLFFW
jgi:hypothetical protein